MPIILGANSATAGGFSVDNSCQFISQDSTSLSRTFGTPTDRDKWTWSAWIKKARNGIDQVLFSAYSDASNYTEIRFDSVDDHLQVRNKISGSFAGRQHTNRSFRDPSAWMNIVVVWDSGNASAGDRMKMYINGVEETSFANDDNPVIDADSWINYTVAHSLGSLDTSNYFEGYMAEVVFCDGQALTPTSFGEFDENSPTIFKPINVLGLTFGNNGCYLDFEDSGDLGDDESGNTNDFTENNISAVHQVTDTATNNFCNLSQLQPYGSSVQAYHDAATQFVGTQGNAWRIVTGSMPVTTGKYYYELKINTVSANNSYSIGWTSTNNLPASIWTTYLGDAVVGPALGLAKDGQLNYSTSTATNQASTGYTAYTNAEIVMCAIDLDNNFAYWGREGTWMKSGDPESGASGTGGFAFDNAAGYFWLPAFGSSETASGSTIHMSLNFGNGSFGNVSGAPTAITSPGTNASGFGVFEFDVPDGYGAICTSQMNE